GPRPVQAYRPEPPYLPAAPGPSGEPRIGPASAVPSAIAGGAAPFGSAMGPLVGGPRAPSSIGSPAARPVLTSVSPGSAGPGMRVGTAQGSGGGTGGSRIPGSASVPGVGAGGVLEQPRWDAANPDAGRGSGASSSQRLSPFGPTVASPAMGPL